MAADSDFSSKRRLKIIQISISGKAAISFYAFSDH